MAEKISVYVDEKLHRIFKAAAVQRGKTLSQFMVDAAIQSLYSAERKDASSRMDRVREAQDHYFTGEELRRMRDQGRRY
ncbi:MAG: hypothetical protein R6U91_09210 [Bacillota bacterium]